MYNDVANISISGATIGYVNSGVSSVDCFASQEELKDLKKFVEDKFAEPDVRIDQRTALDTKGKSISALYYKDGRKNGSKVLMSNIESVEVYNGNTVKMTFANGNVQTATAQNGDEFSFDTGVMICLMKELLGRESSQILGKLIDYSAKIFNDAEKAKDRAALEAAEKLAAQKRQKERVDRRWDKKREKAREARIQEMTEAMIRANNIIGVKTKKNK